MMTHLTSDCVFVVLVVITSSLFLNSAAIISAADGILETEQHEGLYSSHLDDAILTIPRKVNHRGEHVSHNLTHHHHELSLDNKLHYHIDFDNETLHLELSPSTSFMAPGLVLERHRRDTRTRHRPQRHVHCHYEGHIRGAKDGSRVALSACNGIAGLLKTEKGEYWIEPSKRHQLTHAGHPHVIFQRSAVREKEFILHKKKRKRRKKRHMSNCGTKEPKRMTETRIEWQHQGKVIVQGGRKTRKHPREKRSISSPRHVEALIVADPSMVEFHEEIDNVEMYLLTMMNMVSSLYKDPTIGNSIQVVVVRIMVLEEEEAYDNLNVTHIASSTLDSFCRWQLTLNPTEEDDPHHHDVAILITRKDICTKSGCSTLGVANVGGMCRPDRSCSVNEDNGITLAHTITHELGHNFGMYHDTAKTGCDHRIGPILHIMTPSFEADTVQVSWSNCSRRDITHFLDQGLGKCLEDRPTEIQYSYPELPAGAMYNADHQCRLQFNSTDESIVVCSKPNEICSQLWCLVDNVCITQLRPAASGTNCGHHKWCQDQECVDMEDPPKPVDGGWGNWSEWSECSRSCGGGVASQVRFCDHPTPAHGGSFCIGERARYKTCNVQQCPDGEPTFRAQQCSNYDKVLVKGQQYTWVPYFDIHEPCELYCANIEDTVIVPFGDAAADGTPCNIGTNDMCIGGICRKVGCDWIVDSNTTEDQCGVCGGTGETCTTIRHEINRKLNMTEGYYEITMIPSGSRNILVEELDRNKNFLGIGNTNTKEFYLNGDNLISMSGQYEIAGSVGQYDRENEQEKLKIPGPIKDDISVYVVLRGKNRNITIKYEYTLPANLTEEPIYYWKLSDWTACTSTCGGGKMYRLPVCHKKGEGIVHDDYCWEHAESKRHDKKIKTCNDDPCPAHWWIGPWQLCPATCQKLGEPEPVRRRSIMCVDQNEMALPDSQCDEEKKPKGTEPCSIPLCNTTEDVENLDDELDEDTDESDDLLNDSSDGKENDDDNRIKKISITPFSGHIDDIDLDDDEESLERINDLSNTI